MRYSKACSQKAPCAMFERHLTGEEASDAGDIRADIMMPYDAQLIAA